MEFHVPPANGGQIVEVAYAMEDGMVFQCIYDASCRSVRFLVSKALVRDQGDYWNGAPANRRWRTLTAIELQPVALQET